MTIWCRAIVICASAFILTNRPKTTATQIHRPNDTVHEVMKSHDLLVTEGGHSVITCANINVNISHEKFGERDSLILFKIVKPARHGKLIVSGEHTVQSPIMDFTAADLISNRIVYVHDSSENSLDSVDMEVHIVHLSALNVTKRLYRITLAIQVFPRNDVPELMLPNCTIKVIANTRLRMVGTLLNASDADNKPSDLLYYVHYQNGFDGGYFEVFDSVKVKSKVMYFTQLDVNSGKVYYVNKGGLFQQVSLQVSDGKDISSSQTLKIEAVELKVMTVVNEALVLPYNSSGLITADNLNFSSNAQFQDIELRFEITHFARWGSIQRQRHADNLWVNISTFTQQNLYEHRLRYLHNMTSPTLTGDSFHYQITALGLMVKDAEFYIKFVELKVELVKNAGLHLQGLNEGVITTNALLARCSIPLYNIPDHIVYHITALPTKGHLIRKSVTKQKPHYFRNILSLGQNFSQADINAQLIAYKMIKTPHMPDTDAFEFAVIASEFKLEACLFRFSFEPSQHGLHIVNSGLTGVVEGQSKPITSFELFADGPFHANTTYFVTDGPYHGVLYMIHGATGLVELNNNSFNTDDILGHKVHYYHDDSENDADIFSFKSVSIFNQSESNHQNIIESYGIFDIKITMKNDNPPKKWASVMSCVLFNEGSIITPSDLWFVDPDINFNNSLLQYDWSKNNSRQIFLASNYEIKVNKFTQKDIESGRLYLKRHCSDRDTSSSAFTVTDGHFFVSDLFEIKVSDPFIQLANMTHLLIRDTQRIIMFPHYFRIETNAETNDSNIFISAANQTFCGVFKTINDIRTQFTLADIKNLAISYEFDSTNISCNEIKVEVAVNGLNSQGWIRIKLVTDDSRWKFIKAYNNRASVEEFGILTLTSQFLHFQNSLVNAYEVYYTVTSKPSNGKLWLTGVQNTSELYVFTQAEIDNGDLHYEHQLYGHETDVFHFDIQCDSFFLIGLNFFIDIIPRKIPLTVQNLTVREGSVTFVTQHCLSIENRFFHDDDIEFQIVSWPQHGNIQNKDLSEVQISQFSAGQVLMLKILYASDGSDVTSDTFDIFARSRLQNKRSDVMTVHVRILPINDQPPILIVNNKLKVFAGTWMPITRSHLYAIDNDTKPDDIVFHITELVNSEVRKIDNSFENVWNFTQADIDSKKVNVHVEDGKETAFFRFRVTDDVNTSQVTTFEMESILLILTLESCQTLDLFPGQTRPITSFLLKSKTNYTNFADDSLLYKIIKRPATGQLVLFSSNGQYKEINEFTQEDLNMNMVLYSHSAQMDGWTQYDSFVFQVHSNFTVNLLFDTFNISTSYSNMDLNDSIWNFTCKRVLVSEGGKVVITRSELDASVTEYRLSSYGLEEVAIRLIVQEIPRHGVMALGYVNLTRGSKIIQQDIDQGLLIYTHDDSESYSDQLSFIIEIVAKVKTRFSKPEVHQLPHLLRVLPIAVEPINDQHFVLLTPVPSIELVQGSNHLITEEVLLTVDPDTPSENITYEIEIPPTNGYLVGLNELVMSFTQKDINEKRIQFAHDGSSDSGAFYFKVSDGKHRPLYKVFNILVLPLVVDIMLNPIEILQGQNQTILSQHQFNVKTNGRKEKLMYNITRPPKYGSLFKNNIVTCHFNQMEVETGQISFFQDDLSTFADDFEFLLYDIKNIIHGKMDISVSPNIKKIDGRPFSAIINNASEISLSHLDASELAKLTGSDPVYHVTHGPVHGVLIRHSSVLNAHPEDWPNKGKGHISTRKKLKLGQNYVDSFFQFTHSDIANGSIKYLPVPNHNITSMELKDGFGYIVTASSVQPARGTFHIKVFQTETHMQQSLTVLVNEQEVSEDNISTIFPKTYLVPLSDMEVKEVYSFDKSFIIVFVLLAVLIITMIVIIAIRCVIRNRQANARTKEASIVSLVPSAAFSVAVPSFMKDNQESQHNLSTIQEEPVLETYAATEQRQGPDVATLTPVTDLQESQASIQLLSPVTSPTNISSKGLEEKLLLYFERLTAV